MSERVVRNRARYNRMASGYEALVRLGGFRQFHHAVADAIEPRPGALVLDLGCGPGSLTRRLRAKVGPSGSVLGVDVSDEMIERARSLAARRGWHDARFERADLRDFAFPPKADVVVFCLSLTGIPEPERCLSRAVSCLEPGGQLVILDSFLGRSPWADLVIRLKSPLVGADPTAVSPEHVVRGLESVRLRHFVGGVYTLLSGRKPLD